VYSSGYAAEVVLVKEIALFAHTSGANFHFVKVGLRFICKKFPGVSHATLNGFSSGKKMGFLHNL
jgi:hypothetical protein